MTQEVLDRPDVYIPPSYEFEEGLRKAEAHFNEKDFPIMQHAQEIKKAIREHDTVLLHAETGSGKSSAGTVLMLNELYQDNPSVRIAVTQPSRIAVEGLSKYVGDMVGTEFVDYRHKKHKAKSDSTHLDFTMEGTLLNQISQDRLLKQYDVVILDEAHMRSKSLDLLVPLLREAQEERKRLGKKRLKIVMSSATLDHEKMSSYFEGAKYINVPGRTHPIEREFLQSESENSDYTRLAAQKVKRILENEKIKGDILVFMPGRFEIEQTLESIRKLVGEESGLGLFSLMGGDESSENFQKILQSQTRNVIVASDVVKTSLTIPNIEAVVVSGRSRMDKYDEDSETTSLVTENASRTDLIQQAGRGGRTKPGFASFLMTEEEFNKRDEHVKPELLRTDPTDQVLRILNLGIDINTFDFIDHPGEDKVGKAIEKLRLLGAVDESGKLTEVGREMTEYDISPPFSRMLVEAKRRDCLQEVALLIGMASGKSPFILDRGEVFSEKFKDFFVAGSDPQTLLKLWNEYVKHNENDAERKAFSEDNAIRTKPLFNAFGTMRDLIKGGSRKPEVIDLDENKIEQITRSLLVGLLDRILKRNNYRGHDLITGRKHGVEIDRQSALSGTSPELFVAGNLHTLEHNKKTFAGFNTVVTEDMIREFLPSFEIKSPEEEAAPVIEPEEPVSPEPEEDQVDEKTRDDQISPVESAPVSDTTSDVRSYDYTPQKSIGNDHDATKNRFWKKLSDPIKKLLRKIRNLFKRS